MTGLDRDRTAVPATGETLRECRRRAPIAPPPLGWWGDE